MRMLTLIFVLSVSAAFANAQGRGVVSLYRNQCEVGSKGSRRAAEHLADLKNQPPSQERDEAIAACDARVQNLRKAEDDKWSQARQARQSGQCSLAKGLLDELANPGNQTFYQKQAGEESRTLSCGPTPLGNTGVTDSNACPEAQVNLRNARGHLNNNRWDEAKKYAISAQACAATAGEAANLLQDIERKSTSQKFFQAALVALLNKDMDSACKNIRQVPDAAYAGLRELRAKAGGCEEPPPPPAPLGPVNVVKKNDDKEKPKLEPPPDPLLADYNRALGLENRRPAEAERIYQQILKSDSAYKDVAERLKQVQESQRSNDFREMERRARNHLEKGDLQAAFGAIERALALRPGEGALRDFKQLLEERLAKETAELSLGINAYYDGKYSEARKLLTNFAMSPHSARVIALANFYAGAASASEYYLSGQSDELKKEEARKAFSALKDDRQFSPDWSLVRVSPKIRALYLEAAGKLGQR